MNEQLPNEFGRKEIFRDFQDEVETLMQKAYGVETTLEDRNRIWFLYYNTDLAPDLAAYWIIITR